MQFHELIPKNGSSVQFPDGIENLGGMSLDLHFAPFAPRCAAGVDEKRAAFDAHEISSIHGLFPDDVEFGAEFLVSVG